MGTSYLSVAKVFDGVQLIAKPLKGRSSKKEKALNTIVARLVTKWLQDRKNRSIILTLLSQLESRGIEIGMCTAKDVLSEATAYRFYADLATNLKLVQRTR